jgi:hypothetical protein
MEKRVKSLNESRSRFFLDSVSKIRGSHIPNIYQHFRGTYSVHLEGRSVTQWHGYREREDLDQGFHWTNRSKDNRVNNIGPSNGHFPGRE